MVVVLKLIDRGVALGKYTENHYVKKMFDRDSRITANGETTMQRIVLSYWSAVSCCCSDMTCQSRKIKL
jgi:hypothetical protein